MAASRRRHHPHLVHWKKLLSAFQPKSLVLVPVLLLLLLLLLQASPSLQGLRSLASTPPCFPLGSRAARHCRYRRRQALVPAWWRRRLPLRASQKPHLLHLWMHLSRQSLVWQLLQTLAVQPIPAPSAFQPQESMMACRRRYHPQALLLWLQLPALTSRDLLSLSLSLVLLLLLLGLWSRQ